MADQSWFKSGASASMASVKAMVVNVTDEPPSLWPARRAWNAYIDLNRFESGPLESGTPLSLIGEVISGQLERHKVYGPSRIVTSCWLHSPVVVP